MKNIKRVRTYKDMMISISFIVLGVICCFLKLDSLFIFGIFMLLLGFVLFLILKSEFVIDSVDGRFVRKTYNFQNSAKEKILDFIDGKGSLPKDGDTGSLLLYVFISKDRKVSYAQLLEYSNYEYQPCKKNKKIK